MGEDERALLRAGDALLKSGDAVGALAVYAEAARRFEREGFALKAIATWKQIREIIQRAAPSETTLEGEARATLVRLFRQLGLESDAREIETANERSRRSS